MPAKNPIESCPGCMDPEARKTLPVAQQCSACRKKERNRLWREANPGAMAANARRWREAGNKTMRPEGYAEQQKQHMRERYATDVEYRERTKATTRRRRQEKPEVVKAEYQAWKAKNQPQIRLYQREYVRNRRSTDPEYYQRCLTHQTMWRMRNWAKDPQSNSWVRHTENQAIDPVWRSRLHVWQDNRCYLCNRRDDRLTVEHLIPRSRSGPTIKQNIVYSCTACNYSRQNRIWGTEWLPRSVEVVEEGFSLRFRTIQKALADAGLGGLPSDEGYFQLTTDKRAARPLFILSTFLSSDRNPGSQNGRMALRYQEHYPDAIILFDYEWYGRQNAVLNMLRAKMGISLRSPGARELDIVEISADAAQVFLRENHVMGSVDAPYRIGLTDGDTLFGVGAFADRGEVYECVRLAFKGHVPGGMSRIMQGLKRLHGTRPIASFIDTRYAIGDGHESIGFRMEGHTEPTYLWVLPDRVQHQRYLSNDNKMSRNLIYFSPEATREENIKANGVFRVWLPGRLRMLLP